MSGYQGNYTPRDGRNPSQFQYNSGRPSTAAQPIRGGRSLMGDVRDQYSMNRMPSQYHNSGYAEAPPHFHTPQAYMPSGYWLTNLPSEQGPRNLSYGYGPDNPETGYQVMTATGYHDQRLFNEDRGYDERVYDRGNLDAQSRIHPSVEDSQSRVSSWSNPERSQHPQSFPYPRGQGRGQGQERGRDQSTFRGRSGRPLGSDRNRSRSPLRTNQNQRRRSPDWKRKPQQESRSEFDLSVQWSCRCHTATHFSKECRTGLTSQPRHYKCSDFGLSDLACTYKEFCVIRYQRPTQVISLVHHVVYATMRLNTCASFTTLRDKMILELKNQSLAHNQKVNAASFPLAWIQGTTPFEAFAYKTCRLGNVLIQACGRALEKLYKVAVVDTVDCTGSGYQVPNLKLTKLRRFEYVSTTLKAEKAQEVQAAQQPQQDTTQTLTYRQVDEVAISTYIEVLKTIHEKYSKGMDELHQAWQDLRNRHQVWKYPLVDGKDIYNELIFRHFRLEMEFPSEEDSNQPRDALPTVKFPKLNDLNGYTKQRQQEHGIGGNHVRLTRIAANNSEIDQAPPGSVVIKQSDEQDDSKVIKAESI